MCRLIRGRYQKRNPQGLKTVSVHLLCIHGRISFSACSDKNKLGSWQQAPGTGGRYRQLLAWELAASTRTTGALICQEKGLSS